MYICILHIQLIPVSKSPRPLDHPIMFWIGWHHLDEVTQLRKEQDLEIHLSCNMMIYLEFWTILPSPYAEKVFFF